MKIPGNHTTPALAATLGSRTLSSDGTAAASGSQTRLDDRQYRTKTKSNVRAQKLTRRPQPQGAGRNSQAVQVRALCRRAVPPLAVRYSLAAVACSRETTSLGRCSLSHLLLNGIPLCVALWFVVIPSNDDGNWSVILLNLRETMPIAATLQSKRRTVSEPP